MGSDLLDLLNTNVKAITEVCPSLVTTSSQPGGLGLTLDISLDVTDDDLLTYQTAYFNKVEEGNTYLSELQQIMLCTVAAHKLLSGPQNCCLGPQNCCLPTKLLRPYQR